MSSKETDLKEKFRVALTSTAKVISEDFTLKNNRLENNVLWPLKQMKGFFLYFYKINFFYGFYPF